MNKKNYLPMGLIAVGVIIFTGCANQIKPVTNLPGKENQPTVNSNVVNINTNVATSTAPQNAGDYLSVADAISRAASLNNQNVCLHGYVETGSELTVMSSTYKEYQGRKVTQSPYIWLQWIPWLGQLECTKNSVGQESCFGETTLCGIFFYSGTEAKFGHVQAYYYMLQGAEPVSPPNILDSTP